MAVGNTIPVDTNPVHFPPLGTVASWCWCYFTSIKNFEAGFANNIRLSFCGVELLT